MRVDLLPCFGPMTGDSQFPILIGGVGGSGTRVFAEALMAAGLRTLDDQSRAHDSLACTLCFKRTGLLEDLEDPDRIDALWDLIVRSIAGGSKLTDHERQLIRRLVREKRPHHTRWWLGKRARRLRRDLEGPEHPERWFLKEPNLHFPAPALLKSRPEMRFVMVVRDGLDMAFSGNQQQRLVWGDHLLGPAGSERGPADSLRLWRLVHERVDEMLTTWPDRVLRLSFDQLCERPEPVLMRLLEFAEVRVDDELLERAVSHVRRPPTIGRHLNEDLGQLDASDRDYAVDYMRRIAVD